jgi:hypothetical protein
LIRYPSFLIHYPIGEVLPTHNFNHKKATTLSKVVALILDFSKNKPGKR